MMLNRRLDISDKLVEMGNALKKEGYISKDYIILKTSNSLVTLATLMHDEDNLILFDKMCALFTGKVILDNMNLNNGEYLKFLNGKIDGESYEDFIRRIK